MRLRERHSLTQTMKGSQAMRNSVRSGLWTAYGGVASQLVGLSWDAVLHSLDPDLAATEGVFTLGNPSHALIMVGLALTVAGLVSALLAGVRGAPLGSGAAMKPVVGSMSLLMLFGVMGGSALITGGASGRHDHGSAGVQGGLIAPAWPTVTGIPTPRSSSRAPRTTRSWLPCSRSCGRPGPARH